MAVEVCVECSVYDSHATATNLFLEQVIAELCRQPGSEVVTCRRRLLCRSGASQKESLSKLSQTICLLLADFIAVFVRTTQLSCRDLLSSWMLAKSDYRWHSYPVGTEPLAVARRAAAPPQSPVIRRCLDKFAIREPFSKWSSLTSIMVRRQTLCATAAETEIGPSRPN